MVDFDRGAVALESAANFLAVSKTVAAILKNNEMAAKSSVAEEQFLAPLRVAIEPAGTARMLRRREKLHSIQRHPQIS